MVIDVGITEEKKKEKRLLQEITHKSSDKRQFMYLKL